MDEIRKRDYQRRQQQTFDKWVEHYLEHLHNLHDIYSNHFELEFDEFVVLAYEATQPIYDYKSKQFKRYLI